jgi:hypothetical protein
LSRIHRTFGPEKYVAKGNPVTERNRSASPNPEMILSVRVSCHTIAL